MKQMNPTVTMLLKFAKIITQQANKMQTAKKTEWIDFCNQYFTKLD